MFATLQSAALLTAALLNLASAGVVVPRTAADICGKKGYDRDYDESSKVNTYAACSAKCAADTTCKSFGIGEACMLFNIPLSGNFDADSGSDDIYYDKGCLSSSSSTTSSAKTTSSVKTTTSVKTTSSVKATSSSHTTLSTIAPATSSQTTSTSDTAIKVPTTTSSTSSTAPGTISQAASSTASSSTTSAVSTVTVPSGCPAPTSVELTGLSWFNSTHNLDCPSPNYPAGAEVCFDDTHVCVNSTNGVDGGPTACSCVPFCYTGLPSYAYQPIGYGPPDNITINTNDPTQPTCTAVNPTGFRDFEIGVGHVNCGNAQDTLEFYGNSNQDTGSIGTVNYNGFVYDTYPACNGTPLYSGSFPLSCTRDTGGNATCGLANGPATLSLIAFNN